MLAESASRNLAEKRVVVSDWATGGNRDPEFAFKTGHSFQLSAQSETASRNSSLDWDALFGRSSMGNSIPEHALKTGRAFLGVAPRPLRAAPDPNLSHLYIDLDRFAENSISASTCAFKNLNSRQ